MKILAIDSSGMTASVAIFENDKVTAEYSINDRQTHSQTLLPMIHEICRITGLDLDTLDAIAVAGGPGSFTGLRIGSATAKGIGLALNKPLIHIPTLEAMAQIGWGLQENVCPMMDARRNQVYTGVYRYSATHNKMDVLIDQEAEAIEDICASLNELGEPVLLLGDGADVQREYLTEHLQVPFRFAPSFMNRQRASQAAYLAVRYYEEGRIETAAMHRPDYLRVSQAERERAERKI